ncbi:MAG: flavodoxin family protein [Candidatus Eisenbacteria bacterium]
MKVLTIMGSPREGGSTATMLGWLEEELHKLGHEVDHVSVIGKKIGGCVECYACQAPGAGFACAQRDDANAILDKMESSDAVVVATPLFCWGFSGQIKPLIDRMLSQVNGFGTPEQTSSVKGKPLALLSTCGGPIEGNAELLIETFKRIGAFVKGNTVGTLVIPGCNPANPPGDAAKQQVCELARAITGGSA